jgi:alpha-1,6-mannosyltransferase
LRSSVFTGIVASKWPQSNVLSTRINTLGGIALVSHVALTLLSWPQAATLWDGETAPRTHEFFTALSGAVPWLGLDKMFEGNTMVIVVHTIPLTILTASVMALWLALQQASAVIGADDVRLLKRWAFGFAAVAFLAFPLFTQDFWLSLAWGRMIAEGHNPYYIDMLDEAARGMPLDHFAMRLPYGPLWAQASALIMAITGESSLGAAIVFKVILTGAWLASVVLIERLTRKDGPAAQAAALLLVGWVPVSVLQAVAEGHNDIVLVALMLLWWLLLRGGKGWWAPVALVASATCKYVSGILFIIDLVHALRVDRLSFKQYVVRMLLPAAIGLAAVAPFFRSLEFFDGLRMISSWGFLHLRDSFGALGKLTGLPLEWLAVVGQLVFAGTALYYLVLSWRAPTPEVLNRTLVAVMAFLIFAASPHLWPWYLIWVLAPAALVPNFWLSRFIIGMSLAVPFVVGFWWADELEDHKDIASLLLHGTAIVWMLATARFARASQPAKAV